ncbi:uncharacterized protein LOC113383414 [Ctenocephalides felis]|uniref:uncharacterized protein LOC113383414 n=1 Tax=Ctenocephalides felis TaxID=7515 RepID=UPI000E6E53E6|nr:uncharacterized protein LOC113383414 [Ctenocephalides felis]
MINNWKILTVAAKIRPAVRFLKIINNEAEIESRQPKLHPMMALWESEKYKFLDMSVENKRNFYECKTNYFTLDDVITWKDHFNQNRERIHDLTPLDLDFDIGLMNASLDQKLCNKVSVWHGDITTLEIDAIVNAANERLLGGGGVDGVIHRAAGPNLKIECRTLNGCQTGKAKTTGGYKLPAKYIIHTVGPVGEKPDLLKSCYKSCFDEMQAKQLRSIAFPCISTGIYRYPDVAAARIACRLSREFLEKNEQLVDRIIFCVFLEKDLIIYEKMLQIYFPL